MENFISKLNLRFASLPTEKRKMHIDLALLAVCHDLEKFRFVSKFPPLSLVREGDAIRNAKV